MSAEEADEFFFKIGHSSSSTCIYEFPLNPFVLASISPTLFPKLYYFKNDM